MSNAAMVEVAKRLAAKVRCERRKFIKRGIKKPATVLVGLVLAGFLKATKGSTKCLGCQLLLTLSRGGPRRIRTADLRNANAALYQLSYRPVTYLVYREAINISVSMPE